MEVLALNLLLLPHLPNPEVSRVTSWQDPSSLDYVLPCPCRGEVTLGTKNWSDAESGQIWSLQCRIWSSFSALPNSPVPVPCLSY